jgi:hypothetical protein
MEVAKIVKSKLGTKKKKLSIFSTILNFPTNAPTVLYFWSLTVAIRKPH